MTIFRNLALVSFATLVCVGGSPANAAGCNGVVSPSEWGCAPWDNNNGPKFPHYKAPNTNKAPAPATPPAVAAQPQRPQVQQNGANQFISTNGGGIVAQGGGNVQGGNGIVAQGGGNRQGGK